MCRWLAAFPMAGMAAWLLCLLPGPAAWAAGPRLTVQLPPGMQVTAATATARELKLETRGAVRGQEVVFSDLLPETPYDVQLTLGNGTVLCGADLGWYNEEQARPDAAPLNEDDRQQIEAIVTQVRSFYNRSRVLLLQGNHDRAVALLELVRDTDFHASSGEVIWRIELGYFKNQYGGWEKLNQQDKVLRRERFKGRDEFAATRRIRWIPQLGGIRLAKGAEGDGQPKPGADNTIRLPPDLAAGESAQAPTPVPTTQRP